MQLWELVVITDIQLTHVEASYSYQPGNTYQKNIVSAALEKRLLLYINILLALEKWLPTIFVSYADTLTVYVQELPVIKFALYYKWTGLQYTYSVLKLKSAICSSQAKTSNTLRRELQN